MNCQGWRVFDEEIDGLAPLFRGGSDPLLISGRLKSAEQDCQLIRTRQGVLVPEECWAAQLTENGPGEMGIVSGLMFVPETTAGNVASEGRVDHLTSLPLDISAVVVEHGATSGSSAETTHWYWAMKLRMNFWKKSFFLVMVRALAKHNQKFQPY